MHNPLKRLVRMVGCVVLSAAPLFCHAQINTDQVMRIGQNALYFEDYMVAIQYFNQVIGAKPWMAKPYFYRAIAKISLDDYAGAEEDASIAINKNPFITDAYEVRGVARQNLGKTIDAISDYKRVLEDKPDSRNVLYNLALAQVDTRDYDSAEKTFGTLIERFPRYDGGYVARGRFLLQKGDTIAALDDANRAVALNANAVNAYIMRAEILLASDSIDGSESPMLASALADMDMAVKLQPRSAGLYINRAYLRYRSDDYVGAMADYDYALSLEPVNITALFNRGMLRAEVHDYNNAIADFSGVIEQNPSQYRALFNRANLYQQIGDWDNAYADISTVIDAFPTFAAAHYLRSVVEYNRGNERAADRDYRKSLALAREKVVVLPDSDIGAGKEMNDTTGIFGESQEAVSARFSSLLRVENMDARPRDYSGASTRGQIQNTDFAIKLEPLYALTYFVEPTELKTSNDFTRELDEINASRSLPRTLYLSSREHSLDAPDVERANQSIVRYNAWIDSHSPRAVDYFGRAMEFVSLRDYTHALEDLDKAIRATPDFQLALLMRAVARYKQMEAASADPDAPRGQEAAMIRQATIRAVLDDLDAVISISPAMAAAWYDKGYVNASENDYQEALRNLSRAIELKPDMGEAYYNRGYVYMMLGDKSAAFADLSRAGELGIAPSYNLIKRMSR